MSFGFFVLYRVRACVKIFSYFCCFGLSQVLDSVFLASCFPFEVEIFELFQGDEGLLNFQWLDRNLNAVEDVS